MLAHAQRVKIGDQMAPDAVGADDHQRADTVEHGAFDLVILTSTRLFRRPWL